MNRAAAFSLIIYFFVVTNVWAQVSFDELKSGDLLFVQAQSSGVSGAINRSTQVGKWQFDHVALLERQQDALFVLHATGNGGSIRQPLQEFIQQRHQQQRAIQVFRLHSEVNADISQALERAHAMLGKPYNTSYVLNEDSYYCSDFIERAFRPDQVFTHIPMNFKDPASGEIDEVWVQRYAKMGLAVPQDEPGTNPNQLAESDKLNYLGQLSF